MAFGGKKKDKAGA